MSDIQSNIVINPITATYVVDNKEVVFTPTVLDLNVYTNGGLGTPNSLYGPIANIHILGGNNGQYLQTDGGGNLSWVSGGGSGNGVVGGSNTQIQFNDGGNFGGNALLTFDKVTGNLNAYTVNAGNANVGNVQIGATGITTPGYYGDITGGNLFSAYTMNASVSMNAPNVNANVLTANHITGSPSVNFVANIVSGYNISVVDSYNSGNAVVIGNVNATGNITSLNSIGYANGAGGQVTQTTSRTNAVTLNKPTGQITLVSGSLAANTQSQFTLNNSYILDTDMLFVQHVSGGTLGLYSLTATTANGSAVISMRNNSAAASGTQTPVLRFMILRSAIV